MALKRPEGLSPCYYSLASPDIPDSHTFRWTFRGANSSDYQTKYTIRIMTTSKTVLRTHTQSSSETEVPFEAVGYNFSVGETYYWSVTAFGRTGTASDESVHAKFYYDSCPGADDLSWNHIPKAGDVVVSDTYFAEMKTNIGTVLNDYTGVPSSLYHQLEQLFTGDVVPSRKDFRTLEDVVTVLSTQVEDSRSTDIDGPVEDSLGVSDLEKIRAHIDMLTRVRPQPVGRLSFDVDSPEMYEVYDLKSTTDGKTDPTISLSWKVQSIPTYSGSFNFDSVSPSRDIRYYRAVFQYGTSNAPFTSEIYFKGDELTSGSLRTFETNWNGLYTPTTIGLAKQSLQVFAVDMRGNSSIPTTASKIYGSNFKAPLGVARYEYQVQRAKLGDAKPDPNGTWYTTHGTTATSAIYRISGGEGRVYARVRAIDISGLTTPWIYEDGTTFDPLTPPATPKLSWTSTTTSSKVDWAPTARAEYYEWKMWSTGAVTRVTATQFTKTGLGSAKGYTFYVRAGNRAGWSSWAGIKTTTKTARKTTERAGSTGKSWNNRYAWGSSNGKKYVMQGEWCEIAGSPNRIYSVPVGYCWGKNKGMWLMDHNYWRTTLAGKKIIKVEMWLQRVGSAHGYYNDQIPTFWLHNYSSFPSGQPMFFGKHQPGKEFDLAEKAWVTLPNYYGEYLRDGKAKGIGTYRDNWGKLPYIKYYPNAKLRITYE